MPTTGRCTRTAVPCGVVSLLGCSAVLPLSLSLAAEEEALLEGRVVVTVEEGGELLSLLQQGGAASQTRVSEAIEAARLRSAEVLGLLEQARQQQQQQAVVAAGG